MALSAANLAKIGTISRADVAATLLGMKPYVTNSLWVGPNNRYATDTLNKISTELAAGGIAKPRQLAQYIAASTVLHCGDGWSYLGRSLTALLKGDPHRARHLAYYAELRAAMSLMASVGIGVFSSRHFVIDKPTSVAVLTGGSKTHQFVWDCLEAWGALTSSGDLFSRVVCPHGINLAEWLRPVGGAPVVAAQARDWFVQWGMDLHASHEDQYVRNESSYRPDGLRETWALNANEVLTFARDFWVSMEPSSLCRFENVDSHILRVALKSAFRGTKGRTPSQRPAGYKKFVTTVVSAQGFPENTAKLWVEFLCRERVKQDIATMTYSQIPPTRSHKTQFSVFSRAALLLRMATGSVYELEADIGLTGKDTAFWWGAIGNSRGIWDGVRDTTAILDLWADIEPMIAGVESFQRSVPDQDQTFFRANAEIVPDVTGLGSCERIAVWGLTPA